MYYTSFTDNHTRYTHVTLLTAKLDTFDTYKVYEAWVNTHTALKSNVFIQIEGEST